jgi:HKD family nuclease
MERPGVPLTASALLVNAHQEHRIGVELQRELDSADQVDLLCSFLKFTGLRVVSSALQGFLVRGGRLRVLTTCYLGATDRRVLDDLVTMGREAGNAVAIKVSYDTRRTRLHAKAWYFHRESGFSTAYIGSSNLSSAAMLDGLEWNVRLSRTDAHDVLEKFRATFENYWNDGEF